MDRNQKALLAAVKTAAARYKACAADARDHGLIPYSSENLDPAAPCADRFKAYAAVRKQYVAKYGAVPVTGRGIAVLKQADVALPVGERQVRHRVGEARQNCYGCYGQAIHNPEGEETEEPKESGLSTTQMVLLGAGVLIGAYLLVSVGPEDERILQAKAEAYKQSFF